MSLPFVSVVVPSFRRPEKLTCLLTSLAALDYPRDRFEVVIVDDGGGIDLEPAIAPFRDRLEVVLLAAARQGGPASARQIGVERARGSLLAFTDDDCTLPSNWLKAIVAASARHPGAAIGGHVENASTSNPFSTASQLLIEYLCEGAPQQVGPAGFFTTNNAAFPADRFAAVGGMDRGWSIAGGEDRDLFDRWAMAGNELVHVAEMIVRHDHPLSARSFWQKHLSYGRGAFAFRQIRAERREQRLRVERMGFYLRMLRLPFGRYPWPRALVLATLLAVSQLANAVGFFSQAGAFWLRGSRSPQEGPIASARRHALRS